MSIGPFTFTGFDVVVLLILLISLIIAVQRGFLREVLSLVGLLLAGIITLFVWGRFRFAAQDFISPSWLADAALGVGTFVLVYIIGVFILSKIIGKLDAPSTKFLNRVLGAGFGILRGLILASLIVMVLTAKYRSGQEAEEFKQYVQNEQASLPEDFIDRMPESMRQQMESEPVPLPEYLVDSTFYPVLNSIGNVIRNLPFAKWQSYADRIKAGDIDGIREEINQ
jgi:membrane protein required for colicin V production